MFVFGVLKTPIVYSCACLQIFYTSGTELPTRKMKTAWKAELVTIVGTVQHHKDCLSRLGIAMDSVLKTTLRLEGSVQSLQSPAPIRVPAPSPQPTVGRTSIWYTADFAGFLLTKHVEVCNFNHRYTSTVRDGI